MGRAAVLSVAVAAAFSDALGRGVYDDFAIACSGELGRAPRISGRRAKTILGSPFLRFSTRHNRVIAFEILCSGNFDREGEFELAPHEAAPSDSAAPSASFVRFSTGTTQPCVH